MMEMIVINLPVPPLLHLLLEVQLLLELAEHQQLYLERPRQALQPPLLHLLEAHLDQLVPAAEEANLKMGPQVLVEVPLKMDHQAQAQLQRLVQIPRYQAHLQAMVMLCTALDYQH
jgi:hypothetical protein